MKYAEIITDNKALEIDRPFTYIIPEKLEDEVRLGVRVIVPFGRGNRTIKGLVINILDDFNREIKLKEIIDVIDEKALIDKELLDLSSWIRDNYLASYLDSIRLVMPPGDFKSLETYISLREDYEDLEDYEDIIKYLKGLDEVSYSKIRKDFPAATNKRLLELETLNIINTRIDISTKVNKKTEKWVKINSSLDPLDQDELLGSRAYKQREIMEVLRLKDGQPVKEVLRQANGSSSTIKALEEKGLVRLYSKELKRDPIKRPIKDYEKIELNRDQAYVLDTILENRSLKFGSRHFLIHGITGSGKTEIYLQLVEEMLREGKDSIILVPEISLTPQTIDRFVGRFREKVAVLHSGLSYGERFDQWRMIKNSEVKIVVGARSAVFAPFNNLGLIIIDEEHEDSYKSSQNPKYETGQVARERLKAKDGILVLGSATPDISTYYKGERGQLKLLSLEKRANEKNLPEISVVDMREELNQGNKTMFSRELYQKLKSNLENGRQSILFLNRRGFSSFVSCRKCGYVLKCEECDVSMTYHRNINRLKCHYCGKTKNYPTICPECSSKYIKDFGVGTEQVELFTRRLFPQARIARMDRDTMSRKGMYEKTLGAMKRSEIDILIGTQMISKGLDFENVTLVGIIAADTTLNLPDYRSSEKGFQLITQVAGRAGRGDFEGQVVLQTYDPDHYSIEYAKSHDYLGFYNMELKVRQEFLYPPFVNIISILVYGEDNIKVVNTINRVHSRIFQEVDFLDREDKFKHIIGPYPAPLERIRKNYRQQIIIKLGDEYSYQIKDIIDRVCLRDKYGLVDEDVKISVDINPRSIL